MVDRCRVAFTILNFSLVKSTDVSLCIFKRKAFLFDFLLNYSTFYSIIRLSTQLFDFLLHYSTFLNCAVTYNHFLFEHFGYVHVTTQCFVLPLSMKCCVTKSKKMFQCSYTILEIQSLSILAHSLTCSLIEDAQFAIQYKYSMA